MSEETKQPKKRRLTFVLLVVLLLMICMGSCVGLLLSYMPKATKKRIVVDKQLVGVLDGFAYIWFIRTKKGVILVDSGMDKNAKMLKAELKRQGLTPKDIHAVFATHGHKDHISGLMSLPKVKVWVGPGETGVITKEAPAGGLIQRTLSVFNSALPLPQKINEVKDGQKFVFGDEMIQAIHTPGHTRGSTMYLWRNVLFTGDSLNPVKGRLTLMPRVMMEDSVLAMQSLHKLKKLPFTMVADGHGGLTPNAHLRLVETLK